MDISKDIEGLDSEQIREKGWDFQFTGKPLMAIKCWKVAAEMGDTAAQYSLGYMYSKGDVPRNEDLAQFMLGDAYYYGSSTKRNFRQAVHWYEKASDQDNAKAKYSLACCYHKGHGVAEKNISKAFDLYLESAKLGYSNAELMVGRCYELGEGTARNMDEARRWYANSTAHGCDTAKMYKKWLKPKK